MARTEEVVITKLQHVTLSATSLEKEKFPSRPALAFIAEEVTPQHAKSDVTSAVTQKSRLPLPLLHSLHLQEFVFQAFKLLTAPSIKATVPFPRL